VVGLGTNNFGMGMQADEVPPVVEAALEAGINFFDTADSYGDSEERLAQALGGRRDDVVIATKFASPVDGGKVGGARPEYVRTAVERSLQRLATDRIDLYQLHRPDPSVPIEETLGVLGELVEAGKVREIGCSNFDAAQLHGAAAATRPGHSAFASVQNEYSLLNRAPETDGVLAACAALGVAFLPYFPLANGLLTGKYRRGEPVPAGSRLGRDETRRAREMTDDRMAIIAELTLLATEAECSLLDLAFAYLLGHDVVASVIAGATTPEQVRANAATAVFADHGVLARIDEIVAR